MTITAAYLMSLFFFGYFGGKYFGFKKGIAYAKQPVDEKLHELNAMLDDTKKVREEARDMKVAFLEKINQKFEVHIILKDENGVEIERIK